MLRRRSSTVGEMAVFALVGVPVLLVVTVTAGSMAVVFKVVKVAVASVKSLG